MLIDSVVCFARKFVLVLKHKKVDEIFAVFLIPARSLQLVSHWCQKIIININSLFHLLTQSHLSLSFEDNKKKKKTHKKIYELIERNFACFMLLFTCFTISERRKVCFLLSLPLLPSLFTMHFDKPAHSKLKRLSLCSFCATAASETYWKLFSLLLFLVHALQSRRTTHSFLRSSEHTKTLLHAHRISSQYGRTLRKCSCSFGSFWIKERAKESL